MESNPFFWLELRQARRNYSLFLLLGVGCLMGGYLLYKFFVLYSLVVSIEIYPEIIPIVFYPLGILLIPLSAGLKLASQQVEEDILLKTPLSASQILWGKLDVALVQLACLHLPTLPGLLMFFFSYNYDWLLGSAAVATVTLSATLIALGFMAGARTTLLRAVMLCLAGLFVFGLFVVSYTIAIFIIMNCHRDGFFPGFGLVFAAGMVAFLFAFFVSWAIFRMGIAFLARDKNLGEMLVGSVIAAFFATFLYLAACVGTVPHGGFAVFLMIPWCAFVVSPLIAMAVINSVDSAHGVAPPVELFRNQKEPETQRSEVSG